MSSSTKVPCTLCLDAGAKKFEFGPRQMKNHLQEHEEARKKITAAQEKTTSLVETKVAIRTAIKEELRRWIHRSRGANSRELEHRVTIPCSESDFLRIFGDLPLLENDGHYHVCVGGLPGDNLLKTCLGPDWDTFELADGTTYFVALKVERSSSFLSFSPFFFLLTDWFVL